MPHLIGRLLNDALVADMAALPDFEAGAMENWGLVTYREKYLIYDEKTMTLQNKERVAVVIAHERAHQVHKTL